MSTSTLTIAIHGATGRVGRRLIALASANPHFQVTAALTTPTSKEVGRDAGEIAGIGGIDVPLSGELTERVDCVIDFSTPEGLVQIAAVCAEREIPLVAATTGLSAEQQESVLSASQVTPLIVAPNTSLSVNLAMSLSQQAAKALQNISGGVDVEIIERHHRYKEDAPSGTALKFGELIAEQLNIEQHVHGREGRIGQRPQTEIGYHAVRIGDNVGEHQIVFGLLGETLEVGVKGHSRDCYAQGALTAAQYLVKQNAGLYSMFDVLGLA